jgi:hypothetical protein
MRLCCLWLSAVAVCLSGHALAKPLVVDCIHEATFEYRTGKKVNQYKATYHIDLDARTVRYESEIDPYTVSADISERTIRWRDRDGINYTLDRESGSLGEKTTRFVPRDWRCQVRKRAIE